MLTIQNHCISYYQQSPLKQDLDTESQEDFICLHKQKQISNMDISLMSTKIKSSLCKNFMTVGVCPYGNRCQFAHGPHELRCNKIQNTSYKTKPCFSFLSKGTCSYGHRCNFIHKSPSTFLGKSRHLLQNFPEMMIFIGGNESKLLSFVQNR